MSGIKEQGRLVYIDPNEFASTRCNLGEGVIGDNISWNMEDLQYTVDLEVILPSRGDCGQIKYSDNELVTTNIIKGSEWVSFMEGTKYKVDKGEENFLTDAYTTISYQEYASTGKSTKEALGIDSIDINFDAHFFPVITMKFTDVRGASLFGSSEYNYMIDERVKRIENDKNLSDEEKKQEKAKMQQCAESFFKALFRFPYPRFLLSVKGFYGDRVTFVLAVSDFKTAFNATNGNFDVTVQFIGYMYGLYTDIPMSLVMASPYYNSEYWESQKSNGIFKYINDDNTEGSDIYTFPEYIEAYAQVFEKIDAGELVGNGAVEGIVDIKNTIEYLKEINQKWDNIITAIVGSDAKEIKGKDNNVVYLTDTESGETNDQITTGIEEYIKELEEYENVDRYGETIKNIIKKFNYLKENYDIKPLYNDGKIAKELENYLDEGRIKNIDNDNNKNKKYFVDNKTYYLDIEQYIKKLNTELSQKKNESDEELAQIMAAGLGFSPNIENVYRMIFAHIETFIASYNSLLKIIYEKKDKEERTCNGLELNWKNSDISVKSNGKTFIYPFPAIFKDDNMKSVPRELIYPEDSNNKNVRNIDEVNYIDDIVSGIENFGTKVGEAIQLLETVEEEIAENADSDNESTNSDYNFKMKFNPSCIGDFFYCIDNTYKHPYQKLKEYVDNSVKNGTEVKPDDFSKYLVATLIKRFEQIIASETGVFSEDVIKSKINNELNIIYDYFKDCQYFNKRNFITKCKNGDINNEINKYQQIYNFSYEENNDEYFKVLNINKNSFNKDINSFVDKLKDISAKDGQSYHGIKLEGNASEYSYSRPKKITNYDYNDENFVLKNNGEVKNNTDETSLENVYNARYGINGDKSTYNEYKCDLLQIGDGDEDKSPVMDLFQCTPYSDGSGKIHRSIIQKTFDKYNGDKYKLNLHYGALIVSALQSYYKDGTKKTLKFNTGVIGNYSPTNVGYNIDKYHSFCNLYLIPRIELLNNGLLYFLLKNENVLDFENIYNNDLAEHFKKNKNLLSRKNILFGDSIFDGTNTSYYIKSDEIFWVYCENEFIDFCENELQDIINQLSNSEKIAVPVESKYTNDGYGKICLHKNNNKIIKDLLTDYECIFATPQNPYNKIEYFKKYLIDIAKKEEESAKQEEIDKINETLNKKDNKSDTQFEQKRALYYTLKTLYDKWLCSFTADQFKLDTPEETYKNRKERFTTDGGITKNSVSEFNSFLYVDSCYNDISKKFMINPDTFVNCIKRYLIPGDTYTNGSVYEFMAELAEKSKLLFLALPVYTNFYDKNKIEHMFTPNTQWGKHNNLSKKNTGNTYLMIYTSEVSNKLNDPDSEYQNDSFDIAGIDGDQSPVTTFELSSNDNEVNYKVPAFGVTFAKQNQMYFKNINVNMDNPKVTDYSIANMIEISYAGAHGDSNYSIGIGQDIYSIYSNRSYTCTVEMMGCLNIMPTMYFQLNNIPMFRGTYYIINVSHSIVPGNVITKFTGVRVNRNHLGNVKVVFDYQSLFDKVSRQLSGSIVGKNSVIAYENNDEKNKLLPDKGVEHKRITDGNNTMLLNCCYKFNNNGTDEYYLPACRAYVEKELLEDVTFSVWTTENGLENGRVISKTFTDKINKGCKEAFINAMNEIYNLKTDKFKTDNNPDGRCIILTFRSYSYRKVLPSEKTLSNHSFGIAFDINAGSKGNKDYQNTTKYPDNDNKDTATRYRTLEHPVVKVFKNNGFGWGIYKNRLDTMHFSCYTQDGSESHQKGILVGK